MCMWLKTVGSGLYKGALAIKAHVAEDSFVCAPVKATYYAYPMGNVSK